MDVEEGSVTPWELVYDDPEGRFTLYKHKEYFSGEWRTRIHFEVYYFAPSTLREIDRVFPTLRANLPPVIGAVLNHTKPVGSHYMRRFGFVEVGKVPWPGSDELHPFWVHVLVK